MEIKICGLTNLDDALYALEAGADDLGFVLYAGSPRGISVGQLAAIRAGISGAVSMVAVMVNPTFQAAREAIEVGGADIVQVHGVVPRAVFEGFPYPLWRGIASGEGRSAPDPTVWPAARYIVDAAVPGQHGGTGVRADWGEAARLASAYPVMLAGGLDSAVVAEAIRTVRPLGVDVSSGIEDRPGKKNHAQMRAFIAAVRGLAA